jgi:hypothetical protein
MQVTEISTFNGWDYYDNFQASIEAATEQEHHLNLHDAHVWDWKLSEIA